MTPTQCLMARAGLKKSRSDLALDAAKKYTAVVAFEAGKPVNPILIAELKQALEKHGAIINEPGRVGVLLPANLPR